MENAKFVVGIDPAQPGEDKSVIITMTQKEDGTVEIIEVQTIDKNLGYGSDGKMVYI